MTTKKNLNRIRGVYNTIKSSNLTSVSEVNCEVKYKSQKMKQRHNRIVGSAFLCFVQVKRPVDAIWQNIFNTLYCIDFQAYFNLLGASIQSHSIN